MLVSGLYKTIADETVVTKIIIYLQNYRGAIVQFVYKLTEIGLHNILVPKSMRQEDLLSQFN